MSPTLSGHRPRLALWSPRPLGVRRAVETVALARAAREEGAEVVVLAPAGEGDRELAVAHVRRLAAPVIETAGLGERLRVRRTLRRLARQQELPRLAHTLTLAVALATATSLARHRIPRVVEIAPGDLDLLVLRRRRLARLLAAADAVVAPSAYARALLCEQFGEALGARVRVLPPPVDLERFDPAAVTGSRMARFAERWNLPPEGRIVLAAGALGPDQGHHRLVEAVARAGLEDVLLVLPGDGAWPYARELQQAVASAGLGERVRFIDLREDPALALALADLVVWVPETTPLAAPVLAEAQAMGKPVVTVARGALEEVVQPAETGWLLQEGSVEELAAVLQRALALDHAQRSRLAERARRFAAQGFSLERRLRRQLALYARILGFG